MRAWADAPAAATSATAIASTRARRAFMGLLSGHVQGEGCGQDAAVDEALEEDAPGSRCRQEDADHQLPGRRRGADDLRPAEDARATARARRADVGVEV